jgi:RNA polymerase sigma factor (sigma-70 family)
MDTTGDIERLRRWQAGDIAAGDELIRRHLRALRWFVSRQVGHDVDDVVQQTLLVFFESAQRFRGDATVRTFLLSVARNHLNADRRRRGRLTFGAEVDILIAPLPAPGDRHATTLSMAVARLPSELQAVVRLTYWDNLSRSEIARKLALPVGTVSSRIRSAKRVLRQLIGQDSPLHDVAPAKS